MAKCKSIDLLRKTARTLFSIYFVPFWLLIVCASCEDFEMYRTRPSRTSTHDYLSYGKPTAGGSYPNSTLTYTYNINSEPSDAKVYVNHVYKGNTPLKVTRKHTIVYDRISGEEVGIDTAFNFADGRRQLYVDVTVYKEGYKRYSKNFSEYSTSVSKSNWAPALYHQVNHTFFLEKDSIEW